MAATRSPACWSGNEAHLHRSAYRGGRIPEPRIDTAFHLLSWHAELLRLAEMPVEIVASGRMILETANTIPLSLASVVGAGLADVERLVGEIHHGARAIGVDELPVADFADRMGTGASCCGHD